jgi:YD repeat-containing protein
VYNTAGLLGSQSLPYFSSGASSTAATSSLALFTNYTYDALQRPLTIANAAGTTINAYAKWTTTTADPNGNVKDYITDAFKNLATVVEHGSTLATTTYSYDSLNNLSTTTDALGNVRHFTYDGLSRRLTAQDLHAAGAGSVNSWSYTYDDAGNLTSQTDPKGQVVNRTYDALNRMITEDYTGQAGTEVTDTYDSCTNGIGHLCTASSTSARTSNAYDILGRVTSATNTISSLSYNMGYSYDRRANIASLIYPDASQVNVSYNIAGLPSRIQRKSSAGSFSDIVSSLSYAPNGLVTVTSFGNGASTTKTYDANNVYRLTQLQTRASGGTPIQNLTYTYDPVGNITALSNTASSTAAASLSFGYDALNRLLSASTLAASSSPFSQTFTYDALGNILSNTLTTGTSSGPTITAPTIIDSTPLTVHAAVNTTSQSFSYTVPATGSNKLFLVIMGKNAGSDPVPTMTLNGLVTHCGSLYECAGQPHQVLLRLSCCTRHWYVQRLISGSDLRRLCRVHAAERCSNKPR